MRTAEGCHKTLLARVWKQDTVESLNASTILKRKDWLDGGRLVSPSRQADGAASRDSGVSGKAAVDGRPGRRLHTSSLGQRSYEREH